MLRLQRPLCLPPHYPSYTGYRLQWNITPITVYYDNLTMVTVYNGTRTLVTVYNGNLYRFTFS